MQSGAVGESSFDFELIERQIKISWQNLKKVTVNYYKVDPEFMFSASPFAGQDASKLGIIRPAVSQGVELPADQQELVFAMPETLAGGSVIVEVTGAGERKTRIAQSALLRLTLAENFGILDVKEAKANRPVSKAYVKVYARLGNGAVRFLKDGYTDSRGKFDYASVNSSGGVTRQQAETAPSADGLDHQALQPGELDQIEHLAVMVLSDTLGAAIREVAPPGK
jgi:hypothetical protein